MQPTQALSVNALRIDAGHWPSTNCYFMHTAMETDTQVISSHMVGEDLSGTLHVPLANLVAPKQRNGRGPLLT